MIPDQTAVEDAVLVLLKQTRPRTLDDVIGALPQHAWSEVFAVIVDLARDGRIVLQRLSESSFRLSLPASCRAVEYVRIRRLPLRSCIGCGHLCDEIHPDFGVAQWVEAHSYLAKYAFSWDQLKRIDSTCPSCAPVVACTPSGAFPSTEETAIAP